jgi:dTDP-4-amino-4,6-dideoxygalactose transaminase
MIPCYRPYFDSSDLLALVRPGLAASSFERSIADLVGTRFGLLFSDGRVAFRAGLESLGIVGAEVVLPACTCPSMPNAVIASGNKPVFADVSSEDFCMNPDSVEEALTSRTRVVVPAHMLGYRADARSIRSRIGDQSILLVEDYAQFLLPKERMDRVFSGDFGIMSFSRGKPINMISGGLLVTNSEEIYEKVLAFRRRHIGSPSLGVSGKKLAWMLGSYVLKNRWTYSSWQRFTRSVPGVARTLGSHSSDLRSIGFPPAPAEFQARLGLHQLSKLRKMSEMRADWAFKLGESLHGLPGLRPAPILDDASFVRYPVLVADRDKTGFCDAMRANGVIVGSTWDYCLPFSTAFQNFSNGREFAGANKIYREAVELPAFPGLTEREQRQIVGAVKRSIGHSN